MTIDNSEDIIDSRDVVARVEELTEERDDLETAIEEAEEAVDDGEIDDLTPEDMAKAKLNHKTSVAALSDWLDDNGDELKELVALADEADGCADWQHGAALIRYSYFKEYAMDLAEDIGAISGTEGWPLGCIDWDMASRELQMDYTSVDFDGVEYWIRS